MSDVYLTSPVECKNPPRRKLSGPDLMSKLSTKSVKDFSPMFSLFARRSLAERYSFCVWFSKTQIFEKLWSFEGEFQSSIWCQLLHKITPCRAKPKNHCKKSTKVILKAGILRLETLLYNQITASSSTRAEKSISFYPKNLTITWFPCENGTFWGVFWQLRYNENPWCTIFPFLTHNDVMITKTFRPWS